MSDPVRECFRAGGDFYDMLAAGRPKPKEEAMNETTETKIMNRVEQSMVLMQFRNVLRLGRDLNLGAAILCAVLLVLRREEPFLAGLACAVVSHAAAYFSECLNFWPEASAKVRVKAQAWLWRITVALTTAAWLAFLAGALRMTV